MAIINLDHLRVLAVEDNPHMGMLIRVVLKTLGIGNVTLADDGADAFKYIRQLNVDLVITDWNMTPLDGIDLVRLIRTGKESPDPFLPVIMLTGHTEMSRVYEARDAGVDEFAIKPFSAKSLYLRIESVILRRRPFVKSKAYFGPDRRRRQLPDYNGKERRKATAPKVQQFKEEPLVAPPPAPKAAPPPPPPSPPPPPPPVKEEPPPVVDPRAASQAELAALLDKKAKE